MLKEKYFVFLFLLGVGLSAAGGRGGEGHVEQQRDTGAIPSAASAIHGQVVHRAMHGVALQRARERRDGLEFEDGGARRQPVAHVVGQGLAFGAIEDEIGKFRRFRGAQRQFHWNRGHALTLQQARLYSRESISCVMLGAIQSAGSASLCSTLPLESMM